MALENKLGITESAELARQEERISKRKAMELFENGSLEKLRLVVSVLYQRFIKHYLKIFMILLEKCVLLIWQKGILDLPPLCIWKLLLRILKKCLSLHLMKSLKNM